MLSSVRACLGFLTIIPAGMEKVERVGKASWCFPLVGALLGALASVVFLLFIYYLPGEIASLGALAALYLLSGFHHFDGLLDWADAMMVRERDKKLRALKDMNHGVAAIGTALIVFLAAFLALKNYQGLLFQLVIAESSAKFSMVLGAFFSQRDSHQGMGRAFMGEIRGNFVLLAKALVLFAPFLALSFYRAPLVLFTVIALTLLMIKGSERSLGGVSGDILGANHELVRVAVLLVLL